MQIYTHTYIHIFTHIYIHIIIQGADCLGKFSGEAERTLRLLFEEVCSMVCVYIVCMMCV